MNGQRKKNSWKSLTAAVLLSAAGSLTTAASQYEIESHVISGGGGMSASGDIVLTGTIGQPAAGLSTGGDFELHAGFWGGGLQVIVEPGESFETWMENLPDQHKPPPGQRGPDDRPAGDGMTNLLKYALGLMPMTPSAGAAPTVILDGDGYLAVELERSRGAAVAFRLEGSTNLEAWEDVPLTEHILDADIGNDRERVQLLTGIEQMEHVRYFLRLVVQVE